jgi:hypothetical protein
MVSVSVLIVSHLPFNQDQDFLQAASADRRGRCLCQALAGTNPTSRSWSPLATSLSLSDMPPRKLRNCLSGNSSVDLLGTDWRAAG